MQSNDLPMATSFQFALCNAVTGREEEFAHWYGTEHLEHVVAVPGTNAGQMFQRIPGPFPSGKHHYMMIWELDDPGYALKQLALVKGSDKMPISSALDFANVQPPTMWLQASVHNPEKSRPSAQHRGSVVLALLNAEAGQEEEFADVLAKDTLQCIAHLPNVLTASLMTLAREQIRGSARKYRYAILIELDDESAALNELADVLPTLSFLDQERWMAPVFRPVGQRRVKPVTGAH